MLSEKMGRTLGKVFIVGCTVAMLAGCENSNSSMQQVDKKNNKSSETVTEPTSEKEINKKEILQKYALELDNISHSNCIVDAYLEKNENGEEYALKMNQKDGTIGFMYIDESQTMITVDFDSKNQQCLINSYMVNEKGEVEKACEPMKNNHILAMSDVVDTNIFTWDINPRGDKQQEVVAHLVVESRADVYTFADGICYNLDIYSIDKNGNLKLEVESYLAGSGDDDITSDVRAQMNDYMGEHYYSQEEFEEIFYNGKTIAKREKGIDQFAGIAFYSLAYEKYKEEDWDAIGMYSQNLFALSQEDSIEWGTAYLQ